MSTDSVDSARLGPHLLIGGSHDGERVEVDCWTNEVLRKVNFQASTQMVGPDDLPLTVAGTVVYEDYVRHVLKSDLGSSLYVVVYTLDVITTLEVVKKLIDGYRREPHDTTKR